MINRAIRRLFNFRIDTPKKELPLQAEQPKHNLKVSATFSDRLKKINDDKDYLLREIPIPMRFCDSIEYEFMNNPMIIDRGGHALNKSQLEKYGTINPFTGIAMIIVPDDFKPMECTLNLNAYRYDLENNAHTPVEKTLLKQKITLAEDLLLSYDMVQQLLAQVEQFVGSQERIYDLLKHQGPFEEQIKKLKEQLNYENSAETIDQLIEEQRKFALLKELKNFIENTAEVIYFHSINSTEYEKDDEIKKVLKQPKQLYKRLELEMKEAIEKQRIRENAHGNNNTSPINIISNLYASYRNENVLNPRHFQGYNLGPLSTNNQLINHPALRCFGIFPRNLLLQENQTNKIADTQRPSPSLRSSSDSLN